MTESHPATTDPADDLVIAYGFAPFADPSAVAASKVVASWGRRVDVVQHDLGDLRRADASLASIVDPLVGERVLTTGRSRFAGWNAVSAFCEQGAEALAQWATRRDDRPYPRVWSRAHFIASHVLAALVRDDGRAEHWVAEFSDVITRTATGERRTNPVLPGDLTERLRALLDRLGVAAPDDSSSFAWALTLACARADELVFTNPAQRDALLAGLPEELAGRALARSVVRPHATLPATYYARGTADVAPGDRVSIGYFGNLYAAQSPEALFQALGAVPPAVRDRITLRVFTGDSGSTTQEVRDRVREHGLDDVVDVRPTLPFLDFLATAARQDVLLALDARTPSGTKRNPVLLSKLSDYLGTDVPIWAVTDGGSPLDEHDSPQIRYRSRLDDPVGAAQVLTAIATAGDTPAADGAAGPVLDATPRAGAHGSAADADTLAVCFAFTPYRTTSGVNAAKRLRERGAPFDLIQNQLGARLGTDTSLDLLAGPWVRRRARLDAPPWFGGWSAVDGFVGKGVDRVAGWVAERGAPYGHLYSRSHYAASAFLAARVKASWPTTRWTAEFSDPLSRDITGGVRSGPVKASAVRDAALGAIRDAGWDVPDGEDNLFAWAEILCYALADEIVFTNEAQRDLMLDTCHDPALADRAREHSTIAPHPVPDAGLYTLAARDAAAHPLEPGLVHVAYFGAFYDSRPATPLLRAAAALPAADRARIRVHVLTPTHERVAEQAAELGVTDVVRVSPPVPYLEMLALARRMSVLLVMDAEPLPGGVTNPFLPSKWSEYRGSGARVWGMVDEGSPLAQRPLDLRSPTGHVTGALQVLARLAREGGAA